MDKKKQMAVEKKNGVKKLLPKSAKFGRYLEKTLSLLVQPYSEHERPPI